MSDLILGQIHREIVTGIGLHQCLDLVRLDIGNLYLTACHSGRRNGKQHFLRTDAVRSQCIHQMVCVLLCGLQHTIYHNAFRCLHRQYLVDLRLLHLIVHLADLRKRVADLNTQYAIVHCHISTLPLPGIYCISKAFRHRGIFEELSEIMFEMRISFISKNADTTVRIHFPRGRRLPPLQKDTVPWRGHVLRRLLSYGSDGSRNR